MKNNTFTPTLTSGTDSYDLFLTHKKLSEKEAILKLMDETLQATITNMLLENSLEKVWGHFTGYLLFHLNSIEGPFNILDDLHLELYSDDKQGKLFSDIFWKNFHNFISQNSFIKNVLLENEFITIKKVDDINVVSMPEHAYTFGNKSFFQIEHISPRSKEKGAFLKSFLTTNTEIEDSDIKKQMEEMFLKIMKAFERACINLLKEAHLLRVEEELELAKDQIKSNMGNVLNIKK